MHLLILLNILILPWSTSTKIISQGTGNADPRVSFLSRQNMEECTQPYRVKPEDSCQSLLKDWVGLTADRLEDMNPGLICTVGMQDDLSAWSNEIICLSESDNALDNSTSIISSNSTTDPQKLKERHECYLNYTLTAADLKNIYVFASNLNVTVQYM